MRDEELEVEVLGRLRFDRRDFIKRLVMGTAFAVPAIQSLDLGGLSKASAQTCTGNVRDTAQVRVETAPNPSTFGQPVTISALVTWGSRGLGTDESAVDFVEFFDGTTSLGTVPWDQNPVSIVVSTLTVGDHTITATYSGACVGQFEFRAGTSPPVTHVVTPSAYLLAVDPPAAGAIVPSAAAETPTGTDQEGTSTLPAAVIGGAGLTAAAALAYRRSRPQPKDE